MRSKGPSSSISLPPWCPMLWFRFATQWKKSLACPTTTRCTCIPSTTSYIGAWPNSTVIKWISWPSFTNSGYSSDTWRAIPPTILGGNSHASTKIFIFLPSQDFIYLNVYDLQINCIIRSLKCWSIANLCPRADMAAATISCRASKLYFRGGLCRPPH